MTNTSALLGHCYCYGLLPPKDMVGPNPPVPQTMTSFGNRVIPEVIKLKGSQ